MIVLVCVCWLGLILVAVVLLGFGCLSLDGFVMFVYLLRLFLILGFNCLCWVFVLVVWVGWIVVWIGSLSTYLRAFVVSCVLLYKWCLLLIAWALA